MLHVNDISLTSQLHCLSIQVYKEAETHAAGHSNANSNDLYHLYV